MSALRHEFDNDIVKESVTKFFFYSSKSNLVDVIIKTTNAYSIVLACFIGSCTCIDLKYHELRINMYILNFVVYFLPNITLFLMLTLYFAILCGIRYEIRRVNRMLKDLAAGLVHQENWMVAFASFPKEFHASTTVNKNINITTKTSKYNSNVVDKLRDVFIELEDFSADVTNMFGILIVCHLLGTFFVMTVEIHSLYKFIVEQNFRAATLAYTIAWVILPTSKMLFVLYYNNSLVNEVRVIFNVVCVWY